MAGDAAIGFEFVAMGGVAEVRLAGLPDERAAELAELAIAEVRRIEHTFSRYRPDSVIGRINASAGSGECVVVDDETAGLLAFGERLWRLSEGRFDVTSGVLRRAWQFQSGALPDEAMLDALLPLIGWEKVDWHPMAREIGLPLAGMEIDLGGFGKEYAADRAAALLLAQGAASGFVNLAGDIRVLGPQPDGESWMIGIQHPRRSGETVGTVALQQGALATSGDYERFMEVAGRRYCHILDPRTGWPVQCWQSVTVAAPVCSAAGALSTLAMLMQTEAEDFLIAQGARWIAVDQTGQVHRHGL